jgi:hypothetical protein
VGPFCHTLAPHHRHVGPISRPPSLRAQVLTRGSSLCLVGPLRKVLHHRCLNRIAPQLEHYFPSRSTLTDRNRPPPIFALISESGRPCVSPSPAIKPCRGPLFPHHPRRSRERMGAAMAILAGVVVRLPWCGCGALLGEGKLWLPANQRGRPRNHGDSSSESGRGRRSALRHEPRSRRHN